MKRYAKLRRDNDERIGVAGIVLHQDASRRIETSCDRGSIRMFEERLASEPHGDWLSDQRNSQTKVSEIIIDTAKKNSFFIPKEQLSLLGERKRMPSGESIIYENATQGTVYKVRNPFAKIHLKSKQVTDVIYDHVVHNILFPETQYQLIGITSINDEAHFVLSQKFFYSVSQPTQRQIDDYLVSIGLLQEEHYYYGNEFLAITDVGENSDNVFLNDNGKLLFIDPIIKQKRPFHEILAYYSSVPRPYSHRKQSRSLWQKTAGFLKKKRL